MRVDDVQKQRDSLYAGERAEQQAAAMGARFGATQENQAGNAVRQLVQQAQQSLGKFKERREQMRMAMDLAASPNPLAQRIDLATNVKALFGAPSDRELNFVAGGAGKLNSIAMKFNEFFNGGQLPPDYLKLLSEANGIVEDAITRTINTQAGSVGQWIRKDPKLQLTPAERRQYSEMAIGAITGDAMTAPDWEGAPAPSASVSGSVSSSTRTKGGAPAPSPAPPATHGGRFPNAPEL
jgi:hypothetical protein